MKFRVANVCAKDREKHRNKGLCMSFDACESRILIHSVPLTSLGIEGVVGFEISYLIDLLIFR